MKKDAHDKFPFLLDSLKPAHPLNNQIKYVRRDNFFLMFP